MIGIKGEEVHLKDMENTFKKNHTNLKKDIPTEVEAYRTQDRLNQNKVPSPYNN